MARTCLADAVLIRLVSAHGSERYMKHNKSPLFTGVAWVFFGGD